MPYFFLEYDRFLLILSLFNNDVILLSQKLVFFFCYIKEKENKLTSPLIEHGTNIFDNIVEKDRNSHMLLLLSASQLNQSISISIHLSKIRYTNLFILFLYNGTIICRQILIPPQFVQWDFGRTGLNFNWYFMQIEIKKLIILLNIFFN